MEPGGVEEDGVYREARMVVQIQAPLGGAYAASANGGDKPNRTNSPTRKPSFTQRARTDSALSTGTTASMSTASRPSSAAVNGVCATSPGKKQLKKPIAVQSERVIGLQRLSIDPSNINNGSSTTTGTAAMHVQRRAASFPAAPGTATNPNNSNHHSPDPVKSAATPSSAPPLSSLPPPHPSVPLSSSSSKPTKGKGFASRFMNRLSNRKERFQGQELPHLQPARDEESSKPKRSLASKLLSRKNNKGGTGASLDRLAFGGHELSSNLSHRGDGGTNVSGDGYTEDGTVSADHHSGSVAGSDLDDFGGLEAVMEVGEAGDLPENETREHRRGVEEHDEGDGSLASSSEYGGGGGGGLGDDDDDVDSDGEDSRPNSAPSPLTREALQRAASHRRDGSGGGGGWFGGPGGGVGGGSSSGRGSFPRGVGDVGLGADAMSVLDDGTSSVMEYGASEDYDATDAAAAAAAGMTRFPKGVYVMGRLAGFELVGERGTKVPNLLIGKADVRATVFAKFVFEYNKQAGWRPGTQKGDRPVFHVDNLKYSISGNNVPMPQNLIKHILRMAIPGLIQRRLLGLLPKEFGEYLHNSKKRSEVIADVGVVGPSLGVMDADIGFEVRGPARSAKEARKQQALYAAAKEARNLLGLSLPQAQVLAELFSGTGALLDPPRPASIAEFITFQAAYERFPTLYRQLCGVIDTAYHVLAQAQGRGPEVSEFSFIDFLAGPLQRMRRKPARTRVVVRSVDVDVNADAVVTAIHDFTQRAIEELIVKGPLLDPQATLQTMKESIADELEVLHAWHAFALRELQHFKSKFRGAAGTVLAAADCYGFSGGIENCYYEGPLRLRLPLNIQLDQDGAFSFELPLPAPEGKLGVFMDNFKGLTVPSHLRPPAQAVNWVELTEDSEVDARMREQMQTALGLIQDVLSELTAKIQQNGLEHDDEDPAKALTQPRTTIGDRLGRMFVNRLKVRVRLDERRIGEILSGIDKWSMGGEEAFTATAGRIIGHLGDVMTLGLTPAGAEAVDPGTTTAAGPPPAHDRYLFNFESSDISRLRAEVQSLGFQSAVTPGGMVRLVHALLRAANLAFRERPKEELEVFREKMKGWYSLLTRDDLNVSVCIDTAGEVEGGQFIVKLSGKAEESALRATSPLVLTNEIDLVPLGKLMRGDVDMTFPPKYEEDGRRK